MLRLSRLYTRLITRRAAAWVAACAMGVGAALPAAVAQTTRPATEHALPPDYVPAEIRGMEITNKLGESIPLDLTFTQVDGSTVKLGDFFNRSSPDGKFKKPVVLMMVYFKCPILCPMVLEKFTRTLNELDFTAGTDFDALVVSFDPRDKPADAIVQRANQLLFYKQPTTDAIRDGWHFLTCSDLPINARHLGDSLGFPFRYLPRSQEYSHGAAVFVLTPEGKISRYLLGMEYPARDVRLALLEASQGRIGNLFDRFTLWCYHFDPKEGSYTLIAMRVMQAGATLGAVVLVVFIASLLAWERRKRGKRTAAAASAPPADPVAASLGPAASVPISAPTALNH